MPRTLKARAPKSQKPSFQELWQPVEKFRDDIPLLPSRGNRQLKMNFEQQLKSLILFHLEEYESARHLLQVLEQDDFARAFIAPPEGIGRSSYGEALNTRGLEQLLFVYEKLQAQATATLPMAHSQLGDLVAIDGTLIDAVCSMTWADYSSTTRKAKIHLGFDINRGIPGKLRLTDGKGDEGPLVPQLLSPGQTGIMDRTVIAFREIAEWKFSRPVYFGDTVRCEMEVLSLKPFPRLGGGAVDLALTVKNQKDETLMRGTLAVLVASKP